MLCDPRVHTKYTACFPGKPRSASEGRLQLDRGFLKNEAIHCCKHKSNCQIEPMKITLPSYYPFPSLPVNKFVFPAYFLMNEEFGGC
jgi:hypothetical protein